MLNVMRQFHWGKLFAFANFISRDLDKERQTSAGVVDLLNKFFGKASLNSDL